MIQTRQQSMPSYPSLNLYSSPRVHGQKMNNVKGSLLRYRLQVKATNCMDSNDADIINSEYLRKLCEKDGLIYQLRDMKDKVPMLGTIKVLVCVCMYNEAKDAINLTLNGIYKNLGALRERGIAPGDIGVILVQDGILKLVANRVTRELGNKDDSIIEFYKQMDKAEGKKKSDLLERIHVILNEINNYDRKGMMDSVRRNKDFPPSIEKNIALVYQNLWYPGKTQQLDRNDESYRLLTEPYDTHGANGCIRLFSCFKHTNGTKLSSHLWFFQGFCRYLKPEFCVLLDVGTTPQNDGLANLLSGFTSKNIGGVTGFMNVDINFKSLEGDKKEGDNKDSQKESCLTSYMFSIQRAQQYEYVIAHFLDKNQESATGFLHVLPGAWSAYRYQALIKSDKYEPNLLQRSYFKQILSNDTTEKDFQQANMYLAQDRILSLGIYCQMNQRYILKYVPNAGANTDPMKTDQALAKQRRRWINSSLFAFLHVFRSYYYNIMDSNHNFFRQYITLNISMLFALLSTFNSYVTPAFFFFVLYSTIYQLGFPHSDILAAAVCLLYTMVFLSAVAGSLSGAEWTKYAKYLSVAFSFFTFLMLGLVVYNVLVLYLKVSNGGFKTSDPVFMITIVVLGVTVGCFFLLMLVHVFTHGKQVLSLLVNTLSYTAYTGAYSQTMVIHSFCNVDDVSWGTKGAESSQDSKNLVGKVFFVSTWLFFNALLTYIFLYIDIISRQVNSSRSNIILLAIAVYGASVLLLKTLFAVYHQLKWLLFQRCCLPSLSQNDKKRMEDIDAYWLQIFTKMAADNLQELSYVQPKRR